MNSIVLESSYFDQTEQGATLLSQKEKVAILQAKAAFDLQ